MRSSTTTTTTHLFPNLLKEHWKPGVQARVQCSRMSSLHPSSTTTSHLLCHLQEEHREQCVQAGVQRARVPTLLGPPRAPWWLPPPTCRQLSRSRRKSSQLERPHPGQQGAAESAWQEQVCSEAEECQADQPTIQQEATCQPCSKVEKGDELGRPVCCWGDQEQVQGKAEDPLIGPTTFLMVELSLVLHIYVLLFRQNHVLNFTTAMFLLVCKIKSKSSSECVFILTFWLGRLLHQVAIWRHLAFYDNQMLWPDLGKVF